MISLFGAIARSLMSPEDGADLAAELVCRSGLADLVHADLHLRPRHDSEHTYCSGVIGTNATTRPVSLSDTASLLCLHQHEFITLKDPDGRAWRLKVCEHCLGEAFTDLAEKKEV